MIIQFQMGNDGDKYKFQPSKMVNASEFNN